MPKLLAFIWAILILCASVFPSQRLPNVNINYFDKLVHAFVYAVLTFLILYAWYQPKYPNKKLTEILKNQKKTISWALVITICYGTLIEIIQGVFLLGRYFEFSDIFANIIGNLTGLLFFLLSIKVFRFQQNK